MARARGWLPPCDHLLYAVGAFGFNVFHQTVTLWLVYFYAPPAESGRPTLVPLALLGALVGIGRALEAFDDPAIGHWSDVTRSRWGRRLPFIVGGTPFLMLAFILLWSPPALPMPWMALLVFLLLQAYYFCASIVHQPYEAVLAEIARAPADRVRISSFKVTFGVVGAGVALVGSGQLIGVVDFAGMGVIFALLGGAVVLLSALGIRHLPQAPLHERPLSLWDGLRLTAANRQFLVFACSEVLFYLGFNMLTALVPYFVTVVLGLPESQVSLFTGLFILVSLLSLPLVSWVTARRTKAFTYRAAMTLLAVLLPGFFFVGSLPGLPPTVQGVAYIALVGVPMAALFVLPNPIIGDIVDYDETRTGLRREGVYFGVEETLNKLGFALSTLIFGVVLDTFGFSTAQPLGIRLIGPIAGLAVLVGLVIFTRGYRLPDRIPTPSAARA